MPTYEYRCPTCDLLYEFEHRMVEKPIYSCTSCNVALERLISGGTGFVLKGAGWFRDGYAGKSYGKRK